MANQFKYDAFISYRHAELDKFVAENLHKQLEAFNLPKSLAKKRKGQKNKIERVFRDKEELPLTSNLEDPILQALQSSEWLIVICSPRLRESLWCKKEIETFVSLRGREHVLAVLIEGEPAESFPDELLYRTEEVKQPDGTVEQVKIPVEPLAADVRGNNRKEVLKAMKTEIMRILAAMFQVDFDDLRQRHRERRMRRIVGASLLIGAACLLFGVYSTVTALRIKEQKEQIEAQSAQILEQNEELKVKSEEIRKQNEAITKQNDELALRQAKSLAEKAELYLEEGNRNAAVQTAVEALTESDGIAMPYTSQAQMILAESLRIYDTGDVYKAQYQYETAGRVDYIKESPDSDTLVIYDDTEALTLYDVENREVIDIFYADRFDSWSNKACAFLGNDQFVYVDVDDRVCIYDLTNGEVVETLTDDAGYIGQVLTDEEGNYLLTNGFGDYYKVYDAQTLEYIGSTPSIASETLVINPLIFPNGIYVDGYSTEDENGVRTNYLYFFDIHTSSTLSVYNIAEWGLEDVQLRDGIAYISLSKYDEAYQEYYSHVVAYDIYAGTILWENEQQGQYSSNIKLSGNPQGQYLMVMTSGNIQIMQIQTGEIIHTTSLSSKVIEALGYTNNDNFMMFCEEGQMLVFNKDYNITVDLSERFECKSTSNSYIIHSKYGITVLERNDNKMTIYTAESGPDVIEVEEEKLLPEDRNELIGEKAYEVARTYGLDKPEYIHHLYYSEDEKYCFIRYWDYSFAVYDVEAGIVRSTMDWAYPTYWCLGTDEQGYTYLLGYYGCYVLNLDMEAVTWIEKCTDVDMENKKAYITHNQYSYEAPLYNLEELLQIAEELGYVSE